jgi:hypothetical protein
MLLRHATPARCLPSIVRSGLLCGKSKGRLKVVWLHAPAKSWWALAHTVERHGGRVENVAVVELSVPRSWLRRSRKGLWYAVRDIPPNCFRRLITFQQLAASPLDHPLTRAG